MVALVVELAVVEVELAEVEVELAVVELVEVVEEVVLVDFVDVNVLEEVEIVVLEDGDEVGVLTEDVEEAVVLVELAVVEFSASTASKANFLVVVLKCSTSSLNSFGFVNNVAMSSLNFFNVSCKLFKSLIIFILIGPGVVVTCGVVTVVVLFPFELS